MCRLLAVTAATPFALADHLAPFAGVARRSREYQGHGWGCAWHEGGEWRAYHSLSPIWEDDLSRFGRARVLVAHARSAFRDEGIAVENNMPFIREGLAFVFNGELRGVRIAESGRIGAEKLFRFLVARGAAAGAGPLHAAVRLVERRTRYVRAMNFVIGAGGSFLLCSTFNEDEEYFTVHVRREPTMSIVCSAPYEPANGAAPRPPAWRPLPSGSIEVIPWFS